MDWNSLILAALTGGIFGAVASILAPWSNWGVERQKTKMNRQYGMLDDCYEMIAKYQVDSDLDILAEPAYIKIREFLLPEVRKELEKDGVIRVNIGSKGVSSDYESEQLLSELSRLKKSWRLN